jgi:drug/metabolite transporter (DMT)-like permease
VLVTLIWGLNSVAVKYALGEFLPLAFDGLRFAVSSALILAVLRLAEGRLELPKADLGRVFLIGVLGNTLYQVGFAKGLALSSAGNVSFVLATVPATVALLGRAMRLERLSGRGWLGIALAMGGCALIVASGGGRISFGGATARGDLIVLAGTLGWSLYTILSRPLLARYSPLRLTAWTMAFGGAVLVLVSLPELWAQDWSRPGALAWGCLLGSAALSIVLCYVIWSWGLRQLGAARTAIYSNLTPLWTGLFGWLLMGETWGPARIAGGAVILLGVWLVRGARVE